LGELLSEVRRVHGRERVAFSIHKILEITLETVATLERSLSFGVQGGGRRPY
jgi:hypothetical protein